jgi:serine/threonine-protein kinase
MASRSVLHYQLLEKIGAGGMGEVYKAQDSRLQRFVAIKLLPESKAGNEEQRRRFVQEARAASALNHPNIITIHDIVSDGRAECIVMEYVGGKTLLDVIPNGGLRVPQVLEYAVQIANALGAAHAAGIVHRDLKPGNVMVTASGLVKVLDFGLAKLIDMRAVNQVDETISLAGPALTTEGTIVGTVSYSSPEQAQGRKVDSRSDVFSFGAVLYEMLTGRRAFQGDSSIAILSAVLRDEPKPIAEVAPEVPPSMERIVYRCLRKDPEARWQSMKEVEAELVLLKGQSDSGRLYTPPVPAVRRRSTKPLAFAAIGVLIVLAAAGAWWRLGRGGAAQPIAQPSTQAPVAAAIVAPPAPDDSALTNDSILEMVQAKAPASVILGQIRSTKTNFNLSTPEVIRLVKAGVPESVIEAMRDPKRVLSPPSSPTVPATAPERSTPTVENPPPAPAVTRSPSAPVIVRDALPFPIVLDEDIPTDAEEGRPLRFSVSGDLKVGSSVIIARSAAVTGEIAGVGKKKFLARGNKLTFRLLKVDAVDGQALNVRATAARGAGDLSRRQVDSGKGSKSKNIAAIKGTRYIGYIDGDQTISVRQSQ